MPVIDLSQVPDTQERKAFLLSQYGTGLQRYRLTHKIPETPPDSPLFEHIVTVPDDVDTQPAHSQSASTTQATEPYGLSTIIGGLENDDREAAIRRIQVSALQVGKEHGWTGTLLPAQSAHPAESTSETEPQLSFEQINTLLAELRSKGLEELAVLGQPSQPPRKPTTQEGITPPAGQFSNKTEPGLMSFAATGPLVPLRPSGITRSGSTPVLSSTPSNVHFVDVTLILSKPTLTPVPEEDSGPAPAVPTMPPRFLALEDPEGESEAPLDVSRQASIGQLGPQPIDPYNLYSSSPTPTTDVERIWPTFDLGSEAFRAKKPHAVEPPTMPVIDSGYIDDRPTRKTKSVFGFQNAAIALLFAYVVLTLCLRGLRYRRRRRLAAWGKGFGHGAREGDDKIA